MNQVWAVFKREFAAYFATPLAYVFIIIFLFAMGAFTFYVGRFYDNGIADLSVFFGYHPWLYLFLVPAIGMRLWADERRTGTVELLLTLPIPIWATVLGKFLAAWAFAGLALALTFPIWITVNYLGDPDNGVVVAAYAGSLLTAGAYLAVGSILSAATRSQVIAFIFTAVACFLLLLCGWQPLLGPLNSVLPQALVDAIASLSFMTHFNSISKGVIELRDLFYFGTLIAASLAATAIVLDMKKAN